MNTVKANTKPTPFPPLLPPRSLVAGAKLNTVKVGLSNAVGFFLYEYFKDLLEVDGRVSPVQWGAWAAASRRGERGWRWPGEQAPAIGSQESCQLPAGS